MMENYDIDFEALSLLEKAPSKKYIKKLVDNTFKLRNRMNSFTQQLKTRVFENNCQELQIDEKQNHALIRPKLITNLLKLISACVHSKDVSKLFSSKFNEGLKGFLIEAITKEMETNWGEQISKEITSASTFINLDWRLDLQVSTDSQRKTSNPIIFMDMEAVDADTNNLKTTTFQLSKQELSNLCANFSKIKEQIDALISE